MINYPKPWGLRDAILRILARGPHETAEIRAALGAETVTEGARVMQALHRLTEQGGATAECKSPGKPHAGLIYRATGRQPAPVLSQTSVGIAWIVRLRGEGTVAEYAAAMGAPLRLVAQSMNGLLRAGLVEKSGRVLSPVAAHHGTRVTLWRPTEAA